MVQRVLTLITDETRYRGLTRIAFHGLLIVGVFLLIISAYLPWFLYPASPLNLPFKTYAGPILRDVFCVIVQYYMLVYLVKHYARKPFVLIPGLAAYYFVVFTCYYYASYVVKHYFGLPDDYTGSINHFERLSLSEALFHPITFFHLLFIIERAFYPLAARLLIEIYRRHVRNLKLEKQYTRLELDFLKSQINPHFLFNVLNSIYVLTEEDNPRAARIVEQLSAMMRYSLYETDGALVPLQKELSFIRDYVGLEELRTAKRLQLELVFPTLPNEDLQIAPFILIAFVENAFKHGVHNTTRKSWVKLEIHLEDDNLTLMISNQKTPNASQQTGGIGLLNVRKRLDALYPGHELRILDEDGAYHIHLKIRLTKSTRTSDIPSHTLA
ncbi:sensor histidine kinase [Dyadobacter fermentans]|uniref:sensor histidine kinase n=1 Tax=Dyadobacter fermentans TaxID=94254 RepID=UPI001CC07FCA|nr:histidine kinase [Dyadobacter fermentans]MBZ1361170.1 histidine kinase [Dyadobacter fermentans]